MAESNLEDEHEADLQFPFSRCSSAGSLHNLTSSANNTDDEDSDHGLHKNMKDRRREAHTQAEQKRRDAIKKGYDALQEVVPMVQNGSEQGLPCKLSKACVLQKSIDYIQYLQNRKKEQEDEVALLRKQKAAMEIMKINYEQIVAAHQKQPGQHAQQISDEIKFHVFRALMDSLFLSFDRVLSTNNHIEMIRSVIYWVEEHCKPEILQENMTKILRQLQHQNGNSFQYSSGQRIQSTPGHGFLG